MITTIKESEISEYFNLKEPEINEYFNLEDIEKYVHIMQTDIRT